MTVVEVAANQTSITADCGAGNHAIGGGGRTTRTNGGAGNSASNFQGSYPTNQLGVEAGNGSTNPRAWTATFVGIDPGNSVWALCVPN